VGGTRDLIPTDRERRGFPGPAPLPVGSRPLRRGDHRPFAPPVITALSLPAPANAGSAPRPGAPRVPPSNAGRGTPAPGGGAPPSRPRRRPGRAPAPPCTPDRAGTR